MWGRSWKVIRGWCIVSAVHIGMKLGRGKCQQSLDYAIGRMEIIEQEEWDFDSKYAIASTLDVFFGCKPCAATPFHAMPRYAI